MNKLSPERRAQIIGALVEGNSVRATCRMTGAAKGTVLSLLEEIGNVCLAYQRSHHINLRCERVQADEIWAFVGAKEKNTRPEKKMADAWGDAWTWVAMCADTKLAITWLTAPRHAQSALQFIGDLSVRLAGRIQLTTDGAHMYESAVARTFHPDGVDYAQLVKTYGPAPERSVSGRYSPPVCVGAARHRVFGNPNPKHVSTSYIERQNLTMRMKVRRFTRLTNAFSKKLANHCHALALYFMHYNYCRPHMTLTKAAGGVHTTPAMAAGLASHVWGLSEIVSLLSSEQAGAA